MDRANYTDNGIGRYPLSTDGLEFIQQQIELIYNVAELHGRNYILKGSTATTEGIIVVDGEMMPLQGQPNAYIQVVEEYDTLQADGLTFENARVRRTANYVSDETGDNCYAASQFRKLTTIEALQEEMTPHLMPKGAIVMWSGTTPPAGWAICNGTNGTPNLSGRFIVGVGKANTDKAKTTYQLNKTGGYEEITLTAAQSGLPNELVSEITTTKGKAYSGTSASQHDCITSISSTKKSSHDATTAHSNSPPYYVLAYIIKIV